jgi:hypothetical protein
VRPRFFSIVLAVVVGMVPVAPPEHAHETEDHGRLHLLVHRHGESHPYHVGHARRQAGVIDDHDGQILLLDDVVGTPGRTAVVAAPNPDRVVVLAPPAHTIETRVADYVARLIHGPPRALLSLRAPPSLPAL